MVHHDSSCGVSAVPDGDSTKSSHDEGTHFGNACEVTVEMHDAEITAERDFGDEEIGDRDAMPHPVVMGQIALQMRA